MTYGLPVPLSMDIAQRQERDYSCDCCDAQIQRVWNFVHSDGATFAVYFANCYHHRDQPHETWIDVILGSWGGEDMSDHVTFGCRVGPTAGSLLPGATLVQACRDGGTSSIHGAVLSREQALTHPWLPRLWEVVDFVIVQDPTIRNHLYA